MIDLILSIIILIFILLLGWGLGMLRRSWCRRFVGWGFLRLMAGDLPGALEQFDCAIKQYQRTR